MAVVHCLLVLLIISITDLYIGRKVCFDGCGPLPISITDLYTGRKVSFDGYVPQPISITDPYTGRKPITNLYCLLGRKRG